MCKDAIEKKKKAAAEKEESKKAVVGFVTTEEVAKETAVDVKEISEDVPLINVKVTTN